MKDSFCGELKCMLDKFPEYHVKILLGDYNGKVGREDIFKLTTGNKNLLEINNCDAVRVANFAISKNVIVRSIICPHGNIHKFTLMNPDGKTQSD
jgi:hypothetical protein